MAPTATAAGAWCSILAMRLKHATYAAVASAALALPVVAAAKLSEIGDVQPAATPACPAKPCYALTQTTGYQAKIGTKRGTHVIPGPGRIVAWSITLGKPSKKQIKFFDDNLGGTATAQITILQPGAKLRYRAIAQGDPQKLQPYFGTTAQFALAKSIPVKKGYVIGAHDADLGPGALGQPRRRTRRGARRARRAPATRRPSRPRRPRPTSWRSTTACTAARA